MSTATEPGHPGAVAGRASPWQQAGLGSRRGGFEMGFLISPPARSFPPFLLCLPCSAQSPPPSGGCGASRTTEAGLLGQAWSAAARRGILSPAPGRPRAGVIPGADHPLTLAASNVAAAWWWGTGTGFATARWERPSTSTTWSSGLWDWPSPFCLGVTVDGLAGLWVTSTLLPASQIEQRPSGWLRGRRGLQDHHASLLP